MKSPFRFPIRLKIMIALLFTITATVSFITFTMARYFHADKQAYVNDWISIAAVTTADDCNTVLISYARRLQSYARVLLSEELSREEQGAMMQGFFKDLPELIDITLYADGKVIETATDKLALEAGGLDPEQLVTLREQPAFDVEQLQAGKIHLRNSSISERLPWFNLAFIADDLAPGGSPVIVSALLRPDELLRVGSQFKVFEVLVADSEGVLLAHPDPTLVARRANANLAPAAQAVHDGREASRTAEFERDGEVMIGGFASVAFGELTVAAHIPRSAAYLASRALLQRLLWLTLLVLLLCAVAGQLWSRRVTRPVERLSAATHKIAKGRFDIHVAVDSRDEIGELAGSFNRMAGELKTREEALQEAQSQLVQSAKMAAFGELGAGIAHEVKNPLAGILGCAQLSLMDVEPSTMIHDNLKMIERETQRCRTIIESLLKFARREETLLEPVLVNGVVRDAVAIVHHQLATQSVDLVDELDEDLPLIEANANQLQQVLMNLMINAQQAMDGQSGAVTIKTRQATSGEVEIVVSDTGPGMPPEVQAKIFQPFFTTKPVGQGTGLGLSVSFGIVQDHGGEISVSSEPGCGTEFTIRIPASAASEPGRDISAILA